MRTIQVKKNLLSKKVAVFKDIPTAENEEPQVVKWLKPGDKLKTDDEPVIQYGTTMGDVRYQKVYANGTPGWLVCSAFGE